MKSRNLALLALAALLSADLSAQAALLAPGSVLIPAPTEAKPVGGVTLASSTVPFAAPGAFSGTLTSTVISGDASNSLGGLTFTYVLINDAASANNIARLSTTDFTGFTTDASHQLSTIDIAPATVDRNVSGSAIGFNFFPLPSAGFTDFLLPGDASALLVIQTDAPFYTAATNFIIDGGIASVGSYGPSLVPEPGALGLAFAGLIALAATRHK